MDAHGPIQVLFHHHAVAVAVRMYHAPIDGHIWPKPLRLHKPLQHGFVAVSPEIPQARVEWVLQGRSGVQRAPLPNCMVSMAEDSMLGSRD